MTQFQFVYNQLLIRKKEWLNLFIHYSDYAQKRSEANQNCQLRWFDGHNRAINTLKTSDKKIKYQTANIMYHHLFSGKISIIYFSDKMLLAYQSRIESKILKQQIINKQCAVNQQAFFLLRASIRQAQPVFIIFGGILRPTIPQVRDFSHLLALHQIINVRNAVLDLVDLRGNRIDLYYVIHYLIETPPRKNDKMTPLAIFALYSIDQLLFIVIDFKLLEFLPQTATIQYSFLNYFADVLLFVVDTNLGSVSCQTNIKVPYSGVGVVVVIVLPGDSPGTMRRRNQDSVPQIYFLLQSQIDVALKVEILIRLAKCVLVGQVTGHKGQADGQGNRDGIVAVLKWVGYLFEDEVFFVFESRPIKHGLYKVLVLKLVQEIFK